ncbi:transcription termination factor Rho [Nesterenkonia aurantiaca]|uniref:Transcription termination factor Rho n=1 Tax=Nesterenkonia aurantiaca TaxID=1436010 RepID=A0A4R7G4F7_9MICC|nr:transcription termination factor Rho [Nesterenkonia aurantiaca]TDS86157.1 transcription termination factor Rho [Nesterenkonia aurantiaca]
MTETTAETTATQSPEKAESAAPEPKSSGLAGLKLAQLQALASQLGITGSSRMRKSALVEAISSHQRGGAVAERDKQQDKAAAEGRQNDAAKGGSDQQGAGSEEPAAKRPNRRRSKAEPKAEPKASESVAEQNGSSTEVAENAQSSGTSRGENSRENAPTEGGGNDRRSGQQNRDQQNSDQQNNDQQAGESSSAEDGDSQPRGRNRNRRNRNREDNGGQQQNTAQAEAQQADAQPSNSQSGSNEQTQDQSQENGQRNDGEGRGRRNRDNSGRDGGRGGRESNRNENSRNDGGRDSSRNDGGRESSRNDRNDGGRDSSRNDRNDGGRDSSRNDRNDGGRDSSRNENSRNDRNDGGRESNRNEGGRDEERRNRRSRNRNDRNDRGDRTDRNDRGDRNNRRRGRDPEVDDTEVTEDDVLVPVAGILDVLDNYAFVRTSGYLSGPNDVYVSLAQVKRHNLRKGDAVHGHIRAPREGENPQKRAKFNALVKLDAVNGRPSEANTDRVEFSKLVPLYPQDRLRLEGDAKDIAPRVIDLIAPIGKGQRGLIVSPPKAGKTIILQALAKAIKINNPEVHLMMVLVDERPEEVTDMQRTVDGEVIASTFDRPAEDHTTVAELAIERAKRLVELGKDVVVLLDSMTRLGRAYNTAAPASGRILSGGVDANALYPPKRFFGAARNIENGGSLTILATALVETGSKMDEVIFEEFKGTGNMELRLSRRLADKRIFPAVNVNESSTRREENLLSTEEVKIMWKLRRVLSGLEQEQGLELLINKLKATQSNAEFLMLASKTTLGDKGN